MSAAATNARRFRGDRRLAALLLAPAVLLLALIVAYPLARLFQTSLFHHNLITPDATAFIGLQNFRDLLADRDVWNAAWVTLKLVVVTVPGALLAGLLLALAADVESRWRWPVRLALLLPWALPPSFVGLIFAWFFHSDLGLVNDIAVRIGLEPVPHLIRPVSAFVAVALATVWKTSSFVALILLAGLQTVPRELREVARVEGAGPWQSFRHVTLPFLIPALLVALIFRTISAFQSFDIPYAMTQGGPGRSNETLALLINTLSTEFLDLGYGSALAVLVLGVSLVLTAPYLRGIYRDHA
jgi:multiple sugar transport system permease protein